MSLVAFDGTPLVPVGGLGFVPNMGAGATAVLLDAANEACIMSGQVFTEDGGSHTIDTTGSSSLGWRSGSLTFANGGTTVKVGLAALDTATGPPVRAANSTDVITLDVSKSLTGGSGGITANAWQEHVPDTGTKTIANGDAVAFCVQMTARGGTDAVRPNVATMNSSLAPVVPSVTAFTGGSYAAAACVPNAVITFSDGVRGYFWGGFVYSASSPFTTQTWNNSSGTKEYGNFFKMPTPAKIYGLISDVSFGGDADVILYSDPLGTPAVEKFVSIDANAIGTASNSRLCAHLFASPYSATALQPLAGIIKPTTATNISSLYTTMNVSAHQAAHALGANCYAVNRASGAFAAQNSNKDRFAIGLIVGAFEHGVWPSGHLGV